MAYKKTERLIKYNNEFNKSKYDRISLMLPKGKKEILQAAAGKTGESVNGLINRLIDAELERLEIDGAGGFGFTGGPDIPD